MTTDGQRRMRRPLLVNLAWCVALLSLPVAYVASYPVVLRLNAAGPIDHTPGYRPVEWLVDNTPAVRPLHWWSQVCGSEEEFSVGLMIRTNTFPVLIDR